MVNNYEYDFFSKAWDTFDPNHHLCDPNDDDYVSDPNDPDYISESDKLRFNAKCDFNDDLAVGIDDLVLFAYEWLWTACWKDNQMDSPDVMAMGAGMMSMSFFAEPVPAEMNEAGLVEILIGLHLMINDIVQSGEDDSIDMDALYGIKESFEDELRGLK